jgi:hypothetical protein
MSIEAMSFILGGLLVAVGLLGGGIEIRELKVPAISQISRVLSFIVGIVFIGLTLFLTSQQIDKPSISGYATSVPERQTFPEPMYGGSRLDACYEWANRCGEEPATAWCKTNGFKRAVDYPTENVGTRGIVTKLIGTQAECKETFCASFKYIACER